MGGLRLNRFADPAAFMDRSQTFLVAREAEHNLLLGIGGNLVADPGRLPGTPYLATVDRGEAVAAVALMTPPYNLQLSLTEEPEALDLIARDVRAAHGSPPGVVGPAAVSRAFAERWRALTGDAVRAGMAQRVFRLEAVVPVADVPGTIRAATEADRGLLVEWMGAFSAEALGDADPRRIERAVDLRLATRGGGFFLWEDGAPVSMVGYGGPTPNGIRIAPVFTPPPLRGRGYASAAVAATSRRLLDEGRRSCFLFADVANPTANRIYEAIGYRPVVDIDEYRFAREIQAVTAVARR